MVFYNIQILLQLKYKINQIIKLKDQFLINIFFQVINQN